MRKRGIANSRIPIERRTVNFWKTTLYAIKLLPNFPFSFFVKNEIPPCNLRILYVHRSTTTGHHVYLKRGRKFPLLVSSPRDHGQPSKRETKTKNDDDEEGRSKVSRAKRSEEERGERLREKERRPRRRSLARWRRYIHQRLTECTRPCYVLAFAESRMRFAYGHRMSLRSHQSHTDVWYSALCRWPVHTNTHTE